MMDGGLYATFYSVVDALPSLRMMYRTAHLLKISARPAQSGEKSCKTKRASKTFHQGSIKNHVPMMT
jgi:hypothetical protein